MLSGDIAKDLLHKKLCEYLYGTSNPNYKNIFTQMPSYKPEQPTSQTLFLMNALRFSILKEHFVKKQHMLLRKSHSATNL